MQFVAVVHDMPFNWANERSGSRLATIDHFVPFQLSTNVAGWPSPPRR
jgi:hypothetical protein